MQDAFHEAAGLASGLHLPVCMSQKRDSTDLGLLPETMPVGALPVTFHELRCSVCERPLLRTRHDTIERAIMIKCRNCGALQHRRL